MRNYNWLKVLSALILLLLINPIVSLADDLVSKSTLTEPSDKATAQEYNYPTGYFGDYPQKKIEDENLIQILGCQTPDENGIVYIDGSKYVEFQGGYYQFLPLRWKVVEEDGGTYTLLCDTVVGNCSYLDGNNHDQICWKNSNIRKYLNSTIYNRMFTDEMKNDVLTNQVRDLGSLSPFVTDDKMYILSAHEIRKYFGYENLDLRLVKLKPYDMPDFGYDKEEKVAAYWTRDYMNTDWNNFFTDSASALSSDDYEVEIPDYGPDSYQPALDGMYARFVNNEGKFDNKMISYDSGIRPVIRINKNSKYWSWTEPDPEYVPEEKTSWETGYYGMYPTVRVTDKELDRTLREQEVDDYKVCEYNGDKYYLRENVYYKFTPLKWRILEDEGDDYLLMTDFLVDKACYYSNTESHLDWSTSGLRKYVNDEFYNRAFTPEQKEEIITSTVDDHESDGPTTQDKVFLLSAGELYNHYGFLSNESRKMKGTENLVPYGDDDGYAPYYTRTCSLRVVRDGAITGAMPSWDYGLAPVIRIPKNSPYWSQNASENPGKPNTPSTPDGSVAIYRLYNSGNNEHLYTTDANEVQTLVSMGWTDEGTGWQAPGSGTAVYRLYSPVTKNHLYTTDTNEVDVLTTQNGWSKDNNGEPLFYSGGDVPVYRLYHDGIKQHHLTTDENEYNTLGTQGWNQEGAKIYAVSK